MAFTPQDGQPNGYALPSPDPGLPPFSLLSVAGAIPLVPNMAMAVDGLPLDPLRLDTKRCVDLGQWPYCPDDGPDPTDPDTWKGRQTADPGYTFRPVAWYVPVGCDNTPANAGVFARWAAIAEQDVVNATPVAMERYLWSDADIVAIQGNATSPTLMSTAQDLGGGPYNPRDAVGLLEDAYADGTQTGSGAVLHVHDFLVPYLLDHRVLTQNGAQLRGPLNEPVVAGRGYRNIAPFDSGDEPGDPSEEGGAYIAISGPIQVQAGTPFDAANPRNLVNAFLEGHVAPRLNQAQVMFERRGLFLFDTCSVFAAQVAIPDGAVL